MGPDQIADEIRQLLRDAKDTDYEMPGMASLAVNHPGILAYQVKTQPHYQQDMRRGKFLDGVEDMKSRNDRYMRVTGDQSSHVFTEGMGRSGIPFLEEAVGKQKSLKSPYWNRGVLAFGQPLRAGTDFMQAFASTNMNAGRMLGGDEKAADDLSDSANRLLLGIPRALSGEKDPVQYAWEAERKAEEDRPVADLTFAVDATDRPRALMAMSSMPYEMVARRGMTDGSDMAYPIFGDGLGGKVAAMAIDAATDPLSEGPHAIRALLQGRRLAAGGHMLGEAALPGAFLGISEAMRAKAEETARRLNEELR
jgi:hypothetical protein